jgi:hypothetical protein
MKNKALYKNWKFVLVACLTLGLAPFFPEPHIISKLRWVFGGASGMQLIDWFDLILHGTPWLLFFAILISKSIFNIKNYEEESIIQRPDQQ